MWQRQHGWEQHNDVLHITIRSEFLICNTSELFVWCNKSGLTACVLLENTACNLAEVIEDLSLVWNILYTNWRDHAHIILRELPRSVFIRPTTAASSWQLSQLLDRMMNGDGWSRLDPTYVTWFDYRLSLLLWGARNKGRRDPAVYRNMTRPQ